MERGYFRRIVVQNERWHVADPHAEPISCTISNPAAELMDALRNSRHGPKLESAPAIFQRILPNGRPYGDEFLIVAQELPPDLLQKLPEDAAKVMGADDAHPVVLFARMNPERLALHAIGSTGWLDQAGSTMISLHPAVWLTWIGSVGYWIATDLLARAHTTPGGLDVLNAPMLETATQDQPDAAPVPGVPVEDDTDHQAESASGDEGTYADGSIVGAGGVITSTDQDVPLGVDDPTAAGADYADSDGIEQVTEDATATDGA